MKYLVDQDEELGIIYSGWETFVLCLAQRGMYSITVNHF